MPPLPSRTISEPPSAVSVQALTGRDRRPTSSVAAQDPTSMHESWPALAAAPLRPVRTSQLAVVRVRACMYPESIDITALHRTPNKETQHG